MYCLLIYVLRNLQRYVLIRDKPLVPVRYPVGSVIRGRVPVTEEKF